MKFCRVTNGIFLGLIFLLASITSFAFAAESELLLILEDEQSLLRQQLFLTRISGNSLVNNIYFDIQGSKLCPLDEFPYIDGIGIISEVNDTSKTYPYSATLARGSAGSIENNIKFSFCPNDKLSIQMGWKAFRILGHPWGSAVSLTDLKITGLNNALGFELGRVGVTLTPLTLDWPIRDNPWEANFFKGQREKTWSNNQMIKNRRNTNIC